MAKRKRPKPQPDWVRPEHYGDCLFSGSWEDPEKPRLIYTCEDGHEWGVQPDGGVSPDWAGAGSSITYPGWCRRRCPTPEHMPVPNGMAGDGNAWMDPRGIGCPACGKEALPWELYRQCSGTPWEIEPCSFDGGEHFFPMPVCGKPAVSAQKWGPVERTGAEGKRYKSHGWIDCDLDGSTAGEQLTL